MTISGRLEVKTLAANFGGSGLGQWTESGDLDPIARETTTTDNKQHFINIFLLTNILLQLI